VKLLVKIWATDPTGLVEKNPYRWALQRLTVSESRQHRGQWVFRQTATKKMSKKGCYTTYENRHGNLVKVRHRRGNNVLFKLFFGMFVIHHVFFHLLSKQNSERVIIKQTSLTSMSISGWTIGGCAKEAWLSASSHSVLLRSAEKQQLRNQKHKTTNLTFVCFIYLKIKKLVDHIMTLKTYHLFRHQSHCNQCRL